MKNEIVCLLDELEIIEEMLINFDKWEILDEYAYYLDRHFGLAHTFSACLITSDRIAAHKLMLELINKLLAKEEITYSTLCYRRLYDWKLSIMCSK